MARQYFDKLDLTILNALTENARTPYLEIARDYGVSGAAVHQRVQRLLANQVIVGSHCEIDPSTIGFNVSAFVGVCAKPGTPIDTLIDGLAAVEEITECHVVTGRYDLIIRVNAEDNYGIFRVIQDRLLDLPIASTETMVCFRECFRRTLPIRNEQ